MRKLVKKLDKFEVMTLGVCVVLFTAQVGHMFISMFK